MVSRLAGLRGRLLATAGLVAAWFLFFAQHLFTTAFPYYRDNLITYVPLRSYIRARLLAGSLPQWFPFESLGVPFIGQIANGLFHPATWLLLPLPAMDALKWNVLLAYLIAGWGAYRLARYLGTSRLASVSGAMAFAFGGYLLGVSNIVHYLMGGATLPWLAWAAHRTARQRRLKDVAMLAGCWALVFYAGDISGFLLCPLVLAVALAVEGVSARGALLLALAGPLTALLCGLELLPALVVSAESMRVRGVPYPTQGFTWALHPWRLPELWVSGYLPDAVRFRVTGDLFQDGTSVFATTVFAGSVALCLAALGLMTRRRAALGYGALALIGLWLAMGDEGGLLPLAFRALPLLHRLRYPEKYAVFFWLGFTPLVALGVDSVVPRWRRALALLFTAGGLSGLFSSFVALHGVSMEVWRAAGKTLSGDDPARAVIDDAWGTGLLWSSAFCLAAGLVVLAAKRSPKVAVGLPLLILLELWHGNGAHLPMMARAALEVKNPFAAAVRASAQPPGPPPRVSRAVEVTVPSSPTGVDMRAWVEESLLSLKPDLGALYGLSTFGENLGATTEGHVMLFGPRGTEAPQLASFFNGCFEVRDLCRPLAEGERTVAIEPSVGWGLVEQRCWPRAFLAGTQPVEGLPQAVARVRDGQVSKALIPWEGGPSLEQPRGLVTWRRYEPERLELTVETDRPGALIVTDAFAPGWTAHLDGRPVPIYRALGLGRGLALPAGRHQVELAYRTPRLALGAASVGLGLVVMGALLLLGRRRAETSAA